jgi:hypothetical protein
MRRIRRTVRNTVAVTLGAVLSTLGCMRATATAEGAPLQQVPSSTPKLVVLIAVDQLRGDMLDTYSSQFRGGYARLMRGAWFTNGFQDHAQTETAPGHASMLSGRFPRSTGIASNAVGVVDPSYRLLVGPETGASPFRFQGTALYDWLVAKDRRARVLSVSYKDRGAILPVGKSKQDVYWYSSRTGAFTTSNYYRDTMPTWVTGFNARRLPHRYAGQAWRLSRDPSAYPEPDSVPFERGGRGNIVFPHPFPPDSNQAAGAIVLSPAIDSITGAFALEGVRQLNLGRGPQVDLLAVSFSATDIVGHTFGPDSREAHENQLRLDETIGWFLDSLYRMRDSASIIIALTADHGVQPIPELARQRGEATGHQGMRVAVLRNEMAAVRAGLRTHGVDTTAFWAEGVDMFALNREAIARAKLNADSILDAFAREVRAVPGIGRVDRMRDIRRADFAIDPIARRWSHQLPVDSPVDLVVTLTRYSVWGNAPGATHGSPYDQDAHVPIIFYGPWANPGRYNDFARTVDIAPTLAQMIGVRPTEKLDGVVLMKAIKR